MPKYYLKLLTKIKDMKFMNYVKIKRDKKGWNIINIYNINQNKGWLVN